MRNTFRYSLTEQDYILFEKFNYMRAMKSKLIAVIAVIIAFCAFYYVKYDSTLYILAGVGAVLISLACFYNRYNSGISKRVRRYIQNDTSYLKPVEISVDSKGVEFNLICADNDIELRTIYPYSIINIIFETDNYLYFIVNNEVKILPKREIPDEMHGEVLRTIKKNKNLIYIK